MQLYEKTSFNSVKQWLLVKLVKLPLRSCGKAVEVIICGCAALEQMEIERVKSRGS